MFQFIQDLTEEEVSDLPEETLWNISQFYKNNQSLEIPPYHNVSSFEKQNISII